LFPRRGSVEKIVRRTSVTYALELVLSNLAMNNHSRLYTWKNAENKLLNVISASFWDSRVNLEFTLCWGKFAVNLEISTFRCNLYKVVRKQFLNDLDAILEFAVSSEFSQCWEIHR
jgi:hypothetical protein